MAWTPGYGGGGMGGFNVFTGTHMKSKPGRRVGAPRRSFVEREISKIKRDWVWLIPALRTGKAAYKMYQASKTAKMSKSLSSRADRVLNKVSRGRYGRLSKRNQAVVKFGAVNATGSAATYLANMGLRPLGFALRDFGIGPPIPRRHRKHLVRKRRRRY